MRKAVKVLDFRGFFVLVNVTQNDKKRIVFIQKRDPFLEKVKSGLATKNRTKS
jgi:hypothetical protein